MHRILFRVTSQDTNTLYNYLLIDIIMLDISKVKLVIWDLDDTFWKGTLSEGPIDIIESNIKLVKDLTDRGIINTICSKNDYNHTLNKLKDLDIDKYFVFKSIDWSPKGLRIKQLIKDMGLRPANCLFIDDNVVNLNEALFYSHDLMTADPNAVESLYEYCNNSSPTDLQHIRLNQYIQLERKQKVKAEVGDNLKFLFESNTKVQIHTDCKSVIDRLFELIHRTNQLNFTKNRCSREELDALLEDSATHCGYVTVTDNYGDYGIVGFFAIKNNHCIHFLFSCRTIGQGVEQWVYSSLGCPELKIVGEVVNTVDRVAPPNWINQDIAAKIKSEAKAKAKIVFKGACDLSIMASYLSSDNIIEEFTYVGENGNNIEHHNHSINILSFYNLTNDQKQSLLSECVFNDKNMFRTAMFDEDIAIIFMSTQIEPNLGIYQNKETGVKIAFAEYNKPLTNEMNWTSYINKTIACYQNDFSCHWLEEFKSKYEYLGRITPDEYLNNLDSILSKVSKNTHICLLLGSEIPYLNEKNDAYFDRHIYYKTLNAQIREYAQTHERIHLIDFNRYIKGQSDFTNNINHYKRHIYYDAARDANKIISEVLGNLISQKNYFYYLYTILRSRISIIKHNILKRIK